jgi:MFS transporter, DHA1 family, tetracycline resistance protein
MAIPPSSNGRPLSLAIPAYLWRVKTPGTRGSRLLVGVLLADVTCFGIVMPLLASYASAMAASGAAIGALVAVYSAMQFLFAPFWGRLSDRVGRRPVLLLGILGTLFSSLLFAFAPNYLTLLLSRVIAGGLGATLHIVQAYGADLTAPDQRTRVMGLVGATYGIGFIIGPTIGGITSGLGEAAPGLAASGISLVTLVLAGLWLPEPSRRLPDPQPPVPLPPFAWRPFLAPFAAAFASTLAFTVIYVVLPLHVEEALGYGRSRVSYLFVLVGLMTAIVQGGVVGRLAPRLGEGRLVMLGGALMAAGLASLPPGTSASAMQPLLLTGLAVLGIGYGFAGPAEAGYVSRRAGQADQGRLLGVLQSINAISRIVGPVAAGILLGQGGAGLAFLAAAGSAGVAGALGLWMRPEAARAAVVREPTGAG